MASNGTAIALLSPAIGTGNVGDHFIELAIRRFFPDSVRLQSFTTRRALTKTEIDAINTSDAALLCGTNLYQRDWHSSLTPEILSEIKVPVIPFGVGGSAADLQEIQVSQRTAAMIRSLHVACNLGSVRDPHGLAVVKELGVQNVELTGCPVLFWAQQGNLPPVAPIKRKRIILTARNWLMHRWPDNVDHPVQIELLQTLLQELSTDQLIFAVHEDFDESLVRRLKIPARIVVSGASVQEYISLYTSPDHIVLAMRLHAGMLALANGVPAVFVGHDTRTYSFCEMLGLDDIKLFSDNPAKQCLNQLSRILEGDNSSFANTAANFSRLKLGMDRFLHANQLPVCNSQVDLEQTLKAS